MVFDAIEATAKLPVAATDKTGENSRSSSRGNTQTSLSVWRRIFQKAVYR